MNQIVYPSAWLSLTAKSTRYEIQERANEIADCLRGNLEAHTSFFFDDLASEENPESMVGQSLFIDELDIFVEFIKNLRAFRRSLSDDMLQREGSTSDISEAGDVISSAANLAHIMETRGSGFFIP